MTIDQQNYYWLFSSAAQAIAAFVGFLIAGYAIVLNLINTAEEKDDTLIEITTEIKRYYYSRVVSLTLLTAFAIGFNLWMLYLNGVSWSIKPVLYIISLILNVIVIVFGFFFVALILNPVRYRDFARELIKTDKADFPPSPDKADESQFTPEFIAMEKRVREILQNRGLYMSYGNAPRMMFSFREMVQALYQNELISKEQFDLLLRVNKYRNLVFHGHVEKIDKTMLDLLSQAKEIVGQIPLLPNKPL